MKNLFACITVILSFSTYAQTTFQNTFGSYAADEAYDVLEASDGNYIALVKTLEFDPMMMSEGVGIVKMTPSGDTLWTKGIYPDFNSLIPRSIEETSDLGFIISGYDSGRSVLLKLDASGNLEWQKQFLTGGNVAGVIQNLDGGYMMAGHVGIGSWAGMLVKTNSLGDTLWTKVLDTGEEEFINSIHATADGGAILGGYRSTNPFTLYDYMLFIKVDSLGAIEFSTTYSSTWSTFRHRCNSIIPTSDGGYVAVGDGWDGGTWGWPWSVKLDASGQKEWAGDYRDAGQTSVISQYFSDVVEMPDGSFTAVGMMGQTSSSTNVQLTNFGPTGATPNWQREYNASSYDEGNAIALTSDGGLLVGGNTEIAGAYSGAYILKTDSLGFATDCFAQTTTSTGSSNVGNTYTEIGTTSPLGFSIVTGTLNETAGLEFYKLIPNVTAVSTDPLCDEDCNGEGQVSAVDGQGSYTWLWSTGGNLSTEIGLCPAWYYVDVTDAGGCVVQDSMEIIAPSSVVVTGVVSHVTCNGDFDGAIDITVSGGAGNYEFDWPTGATSEDLSGLGGGFYLVNVEDSNGCDEQFGAIIQEPQVLASYITATTDASCKDMCDGEIATLTIGGTAPYTLLWNDPLAQTVDTAIGLCDGTYLLTVTDNNGCIAYLNGNIIEPDELFTSTNSSSTECGLSSGEAWVVPTGGTMPYAYDWNGMGSNDTLSSLDAGWYDVLVTDNNGCTAMDSALIESFVSPIDICVVTVDSIGENVVNWNKPAAGNIDGFKIYRNIAGVYTPVGYRDYDSLSYYVDTDFGVDPAVTSYRYKVSVVDTCGAESDLSGFHETIHLTSNVGTGGEVNLIWDDYEGFSFGFYDILRDSTGTEDWEVIGTVPFTNFTFIDFNVPSSGADYMIEVVTPAFCDATKAIGDFNSSRSNRKSGVANVSGIFDAEALALNMYPNPATNMLYVEANMAYASDVNFSILDYTGKLILTENDQNLAGSIRKGIDIESLPVGYYILEFATADGSVRKQFVKM